MIKYITFIVVALAILPTAYGLESQYVCIDSDSLNEYSEIITGNQTITMNETTLCPHGCSYDFQSCKPNPLTTNSIGFGIPLLSLIIGALSMRKNNVWTISILVSLLIVNGVMLFFDIFTLYIKTMASSMIFFLSAITIMSFLSLIRRTNEEGEDDE